MATQLQSDDSLVQLDVSRMEMWRDDAWRAPFQRLLSVAPVHRCTDSIFGPYWSITRHADIMAVEGTVRPMWHYVSVDDNSPE